MIDEMTLFQVEELGGYWHKHPPVHLLVAGFVGYRAEDVPTTSDEPTELPPELFMMPGVAPGVLPPNMPQPKFDFEELMRQ